MAVARESEAKGHLIDQDYGPRTEVKGLRFGEARRRARHERAASGRANAVRTAANAPGAAAIYADAVIDYWETARLAGDVDPREPLYLFEPGARDGRLTYFMIEALIERLAAPTRTHFDFCYLAADTSAEWLDFIATHPYLRSFVDAGRLDTVLWDPERGGPWRLRERGRQVAQLRNPLVIIADGVFAELTHDLLGFQYGRMFDGRIVDPGTDEKASTCRWHPIPCADWLPPSWEPLLADYLARIDSAPMLLPSGALRCIDHLSPLAQQRYLLLCADRGVASEQALRSGASADFAGNGHGPLPVNFHALAAHQRRLGAHVWTDHRREDGSVIHLALSGVNDGVYERGFDALVRRFQAAGPDDGAALTELVPTVADHVSLERSLLLVRLSRHDPRVLAAAFTPLLAKIDELTDESCRLWRETLERAWANYFPCADDNPFHFNLGLVAAHLGHWALAKEAFRLGLAICPTDAAALHHLALCEASTGHVPEAIALLDRALASEPANPSCRGLRRALAERLDAWDATPWYRRDLATDEDLTLEPVGAEHLAALQYQLRDPQIGIMARLPEFATPQDVQRWLEEEHGEPGRATYAVMHADHGFIGVVSLRRHGEAGYFYFWIGTDYQGAGFGRRAAALLFRHAAALGIGEIFTSVYPDNARSRRALEYLAFVPVDIAAREPDRELIFLHLRLAGRAGDAPVAERLRALCRAIASPIEFCDAAAPRVAPLQPVG